MGGRDARDIPLEELRQQVSVVTQDTYLFHGTVADNLRFGNPHATQTELEEAARAANAHEFIHHLPQGYETVVGERAVRLSGGQKQRIAIARALLKDAPILILDEALSSVDAENEAVIVQALDRLIEGRTTLRIAHRLSSVVNADRILVLDEGRLVESGRHAELVAAGSLYAETDGPAAGAAGLRPRPCPREPARRTGASSRRLTSAHSCPARRMRATGITITRLRSPTAAMVEHDHGHEHHSPAQPHHDHEEHGNRAAAHASHRHS